MLKNQLYDFAIEIDDEPYSENLQNVENRPYDLAIEIDEDEQVSVNSKEEEQLPEFI